MSRTFADGSGRGKASERGLHATFDSALAAALKDLTTERNDFFDAVADAWPRLFPGVAARPGRFDDGRIVLYAKSPAALYATRMKLGAVRRRLSELPDAPKRIDLRLEVHS